MHQRQASAALSSSAIVDGWFARQSLLVNARRDLATIAVCRTPGNLLHFQQLGLPSKPVQALWRPWEDTLGRTEMMALRPSCVAWRGCLKLTLILIWWEATRTHRVPLTWLDSGSPAEGSTACHLRRYEEIERERCLPLRRACALARAIFPVEIYIRVVERCRAQIRREGFHVNRVSSLFGRVSSV